MIQPVPQDGRADTVAIETIQTRGQIRTRNGFDQQSLSELAASIRQRGILQPLVVTQLPGEPGYTLIAGERRLLAASMAGLTDIPVFIRSGTAIELAADQAIENLQREDLHPADVADGLAALASAMNGSWREVARAIGKSPAWVSKHRALSRLRPVTMQAMREGLTADPELLLALDQLERMPHAVAIFEQQIRMLTEGAATRATVRAALAKAKAPIQPDPEPEDDGETESDSAAKPAGLTGKLELAEDSARTILAALEYTKKHKPSSRPSDVLIQHVQAFIAKQWPARIDLDASMAAASRKHGL